MGFISNVDEEKKLNNADYQNAIAEAICQGVCDYFGVTKKSKIPQDYSKEAIEWAINNGILKGDGNNCKLDENIIRKDVLVFLHRLYKKINKRKSTEKNRCLFFM